MPCYDSRADDDARDNAAYIHDLTALLCSMCNAAPDAMDDRTRAWFKAHDLIDKRRAAKGDFQRSGYAGSLLG